MRPLLTALCLGALTLAHVSRAEADCTLNISVKNTSATKLAVYSTSPKTTVKSKGGSWRMLAKGGWLNNNPDPIIERKGQLGGTYHAALGCGRKRRYRILYRCKDGTRAAYFPSPTGWTRKQTLTVSLPACRP